MRQFGEPKAFFVAGLVGVFSDLDEGREEEITNKISFPYIAFFNVFCRHSSWPIRAAVPWRYPFSGRPACTRSRNAVALKRAIVASAVSDARMRAAFRESVTLIEQLVEIEAGDRPRDLFSRHRRGSEGRSFVAGPS